MPRALLSSRPPTDSVFLQPWIHRTVASLDVCLSDIVIPRLEPNDLSDPLMSPTVLSNCCHFVKISKFCSVDHYHVYAAARDSETQILSWVYTRVCITIRKGPSHKNNIRNCTLRLRSRRLPSGVPVTYIPRNSLESRYYRSRTYFGSQTGHGIWLGPSRMHSWLPATALEDFCGSSIVAVMPFPMNVCNDIFFPMRWSLATL